jgi:hypothetical protein
MSTRKHDVHLYGVGGRTIAKTYYNDLKVVRRKRPGVVFLQVGGNDILKDSSPTLILVRMKRLVSVLLEKYHVSTVIVGSVFCRRKPRGLSRRAYDRKKQNINKFLSKEFGRNTSTETEFTSTKMETDGLFILITQLKKTDKRQERISLKNVLALKRAVCCNWATGGQHHWWNMWLFNC